MFVQVLRVEIPGVIPVIESVMPVLDASGEGLTACRRLSESLRQVAKDSGALFLDVEEVVRRHLAGAAQPTSCFGAGAQRPDERPASALAASPVDASGGIRLVAAAAKSTYEAVAAANIAATTAEASVAAAINKEDYQRAASDAAEAARASKAALELAANTAAATTAWISDKIIRHTSHSRWGLSQQGRPAGRLRPS